MGMGRSLNDAMEKASGEWIARLDGDDVMLPERLERQIAFLRENPDLVVLSSLVYYIDEAGKVIGKNSSKFTSREAVAETVKRFKREIRLTHENFLRFTHRYWFHEVSNEGPGRDMFERWVAELGTDRLFAEVREEVNDMIDYLDSDGLRRQANSVVRLTVVTFFGLIGTIATGFTFQGQMLRGALVSVKPPAERSLGVANQLCLDEQESTAPGTQSGPT